MPFFFFTAVPTWNDRKRVTHQRLLEIYEDLGVIVRHGSFKPTSAICRLCGKEFTTFEEKQTDINICIELLRLGRDDIADRISLVTGDNDQAASVQHFRQLYPDKEVIVVIPPYRRALELESVASARRAMSIVQLKKSLLPNPYKFRLTDREYLKPAHWTNRPVAANWQPRDRSVHRPE